MTSSEYAEYTRSEVRLNRRKEYLASHGECNRCQLPRYLAKALYDQDLNVHHRNYQRLNGCERDEDLEALCRRCHEIETRRSSTLKAPWSDKCSEEGCKRRIFDPFNPFRRCDECMAEIVRPILRDARTSLERLMNFPEFGARSEMQTVMMAIQQTLGGAPKKPETVRLEWFGLGEWFPASFFLENAKTAGLQPRRVG